MPAFAATASAQIAAVPAAATSSPDAAMEEARRLSGEGGAAAQALDYPKAIERFEQSLAILESVVGREHVEVALTLNNMAVVYEWMGAYEKALPLAQRSLAIYQKRLGADHPDVATSLNNVAGLYDSMGRYDEALPLYLRSLAIREQRLGPGDPAVATSLNNLAALYRATSAYDKALALYERSLAIYEKAYGGGHPDVANALGNLAVLREAMGAYEIALPLYERSLAIRQKTLGADHPSTGTSLNNLALLHRTLGAYDKALPLAQRSLAIRENALGPEHPTVATSLNNVAALYELTGANDAALPLYLRSLAIREKTLPATHPDLATSLNNLAALYGYSGAYDKALPLYQRSLAIYERSLGPGHPDVANSLNNMGLLYQAMGAYDKALPVHERALGIAAPGANPVYLTRIYNGLSQLHARAGRPALGIFFGKQAVNALQAVRLRLADLEKGLQQSFLSSNAGDYQHLAGLLVADGRLPEAQQVLAMLKEEELFEFLRSGGAEDVKKTRATFSADEARWAARFQDIGGRLAAIGSELESLEKKAKAGLSESEKARRSQLESDRGVGQQAFERFLADLTKELGETVSRERDREIAKRNLADVESLQETLSLLGHGAVTLHYLVLEDRTHIILTTPQVQLVRESRVSSRELNRKIQYYRETLQKPNRDPLPLAQELYRLLVAPVADDLAQAKASTLMVSLDGALRYLPLAALHDGTGYVAEKYAVALYTEAAKDRLRDKPSAQWTFSGLGLTREIEGFSPLPAVREELEGIVKGGILPGELHFDSQFDAAQLRATLDKSAPVLHIASHFVFRPGAETNSFLLLGDGSQVTLDQLRRYRFRDVDLLTLSACETAVGGGRDENGREVEGFAALAQRQGAKGVLATLWPVADRSTGEFMRTLYSIRQSAPGTTKAEALRQTQLRFIGGDAGQQAGTGRDKPYAHPFYWAPFVLMGNWL